MSAVRVQLSPPIARIVVEVRGRLPDSVALDTVFAVARAYKARIEGMFVEQQGLASLANLSCARHVSFAGQCSGANAFASFETASRSAISAVRRDFERRAKADDLALEFDVVREESDSELSAHCGEGSLVLLTGGLNSETAIRLSALLNGPNRIAGVLLVGPHARANAGSIVAVASDQRGLEKAVRTAIRLQLGETEPIRLVLAGSSREDLAMLAAFAERLVPPDISVTLIPARITPGATAAFIYQLGRIPGRLMILPIGSAIAASAEVIRALANGLDRPLLLLK